MANLFTNTDNTFCNNEACPKRLTCTRHIFFYEEYKDHPRLSFLLVEDDEVANCDLYIPISDVKMECITIRYEAYIKKGLRKGQALINVVQELHPESMEYIKEEDLDCFYNDEKVMDVWKMLYDKLKNNKQ